MVDRLIGCSSGYSFVAFLARASSSDVARSIREILWSDAMNPEG